MATYRRELADSGYPRGSKHKGSVRNIRENIDAMRFDLLTMQKCIGNSPENQDASYAGIALLFGVLESSPGADDKNAVARALYGDLVGFFNAWDASTADNCRGYLGLVG